MRSKDNMNLLDDARLIRSLQLAYSAERAAAFAYIGHARSLSNQQERESVQDIENDEWQHRAEVRSIMDEYNIRVSRWLEFKFFLIGRFISASCFVIGRFMPYFFAGKLESGNVCEYFVMIHRFHALGITRHDHVLFEMGMKEKQHEVYFLEMIKNAKWLPLFEKIFGWGRKASANDVDIDATIENVRPDDYCRTGSGST